MKYNGIWNFEAYGLCLKVNFGIVKIYQISENTLIENKDYKGFVIFGKLYCGLGKFKFIKEDNSMIIKNEPAQTEYITYKISDEELASKTMVDENPVVIFKAYYETIKENYAFYDLYDVDIDERYDNLSLKISENTNKEELFDYMCQMIEGLDDAHTYVSFKEKEYSFHKAPTWWDDREQLKVITDLIKTKYVKDYNLIKECPVRYGTLNEKTGYILLRAMGTEELDQVSTTQKYFEKIIKEFIDKEAIVIDMRFNSGGFDSASLMTAGYFTQDKYLAYKKQAFYNGNLTNIQEAWVKPSDISYTGKVIVLTSEFTVSAGETLISSLIANPNIDITIIGEETAGNYSDCIEKFATIDGEIRYGLSNEIFYSSNDEKLEGTGILPDEYIPVDYEEAKDGTDAALDFVINMMK